MACVPLLLRLSSVPLFAFSVMMALRGLTSFEPHAAVYASTFALGLPALLYGVWWTWREARR